MFSSAYPLIFGALCLFLLYTPTLAVAASDAADPARRVAQQPPASAQSQISPAQRLRLDALFEQLKKSEDEVQARQLSRKIWAIWKSPADAGLLEQMKQAEYYFGVGKRDEAFRILDRAVANYPDYSEIWNLRATYYFYNGQYPQSLQDIAKTLELEPRHFGAMSGKIVILLQQRKQIEALETLLQALKINPFMPERKMLLPDYETDPSDELPGQAI